MGCPVGISKSTYDRPAYFSGPAKVVVEVVHHHKTTKPRAPQGNPNPFRYTILKSQQHGLALIVKVHYPDATTYEGVKILVYSNGTLAELTSQSKGIDPHFSPSKSALSPFARFEPTNKGWQAAVRLAKSL